jgi:hypothetical protein
MNAGFLGQTLHDRPDVLEVRDAGAAGWVRGAHLEKHVPAPLDRTGELRRLDGDARVTVQMEVQNFICLQISEQTIIGSESSMPVIPIIRGTAPGPRRIRRQSEHAIGLARGRASQDSTSLPESDFGYQPGKQRPEGDGGSKCRHCYGY